MSLRQGYTDTPAHDNIMAAVTSQLVGGKDGVTTGQGRMAIWMGKRKLDLWLTNHEQQQQNQTQAKHPGGLKN